MKKIILTFTFSLLFVGLTGCVSGVENNTDQGDAKIGEKLKKGIGSTYYLDQVVYADGHTDVVTRFDVVLKLTAEDRIEGQIICNPFKAQLAWSTDGTITISDWQKSNRNCLKPDPMNFELKMKYTFSEREIVFTDMAGTWAAHFVL